jgi:hypothetical protein
MYPSASLCRSQQAAQLERAAAAILVNVRTIAEAAAAAWGVEAVLAERREQRRGAPAQAADAAHRERERRDADMSENPDRGHAAH